MDIFKTLENTIKKHNLIESSDRILLGLSGGADSVCLFHAFLDLSSKMEFTFAAAHINHQLRDTAGRDEDFCRELCKKYGVEFFSKTVDIKREAESAKMSEELYARNVRYDFFKSLGFTKIATAHNRNDTAETLLFNFMRGSALSGLSGIPYRRENIIRPLLDIKKQDILEFCKLKGFDFVTDETNFEALYTRNKIRLNLIPKIERDFNKGFVDVVTKNAELIRDDAEFLDSLAQKEYTGKIVLESFLKLPVPLKRRVLQLAVRDSANMFENSGSVYIEDILAICEKNETGKSIDLPNGFCAKIEYGRLIIEKKQEIKNFCYKIEEDVVLNIPEIGKALVMKRSEDGNIHLDNTDGLVVRSKREGDVFCPQGMTGKKKLSDFFTDKKIPKAERTKIPILEQNGEIVAVLGHRCDRRFCGKTAYKIEIMEDAHAK